MSRIKEFPTYITNYDNISSPYGNQLVSDDSKKLNLDSVFRRSNNNLINIEHHSSISQYLMRRDYEYAVNLHLSTEEKVEPFIFYTGKLPVEKVSYLNDTMFFNPKWIITQEIDGDLRRNNILYKNHIHEDLNVYEILDFIWLPTFRTDMRKEDLILKQTEIYENIHSEEYLKDIAKKCLSIWVAKNITNKEDLKKVQKRLSMSATEIRSLEEEIKNARIVGELERAEEKGKRIGKEKGIKIGEEKEKQKWKKKIQQKEEIIKEIAQNLSPEELSKLNIPQKEIEKYLK